jgi:hypothetical protein
MYTDRGCPMPPLPASRFLADGQLVQRLRAAADAQQLRSLMQQLDRQGWLQAAVASLRQQQALPPAPPAALPELPGQQAAAGVAPAAPAPPPGHPLSRPGTQSGYTGVVASTCGNGLWVARACLQGQGGSKFNTTLSRHQSPEAAAVAADVAVFWKTHVRGWCGPLQRPAALSTRWARRRDWQLGRLSLLCTHA